MWIEFICFRVLIPLLICACVTIRPVLLFSTIYLIFLFVSPYISLRTSKAYLRTIFSCCLMLSSLAALILHVIVQIKFIRKYLNGLFDHEILGIIVFESSRFWEIFQVLLSDIAIFVCSIIVIVLNKKFREKPSKNLTNVTVQNTNTKHGRQHENGLFRSFLKVLCLMTLCLCGAICATLINLVYFVTFLICSMLIASNHKLGRKFSISLKILTILMALHTMAITLYQVKYFQKLFPSENLEIRLIGLHKIFSMSESEIFFNAEINWDVLLQPMVLILSYLFISNASNVLMKQEIKKPEEIDETQNESFKFPQIIRNFMFRHAYILTILSMMIWSIVYHSWLGFVFLMISNLILIMKNQWIRMLQLSPYISTYACLLILINYAYGMNLSDIELPDTFDGINMEQIGIIKYKSYVGIHLILKSIMTVPFWIVMQQSKMLNTNFSDSPVIISKKINYYVIQPLIKAFTFGLMWIIIIIVFSMAVTHSSETTIFGIANMLFAMTYVLIFQISVALWKNIMYLYWIVLIIYTKIILILIYIFQFDGFLELPYHRAIGLKKYKTTQLFLKLISLTLVTILGGIQLNYCHARFLKYFETSKRNNSVEDDANDENKHLKTFKSIVKKSLLFVEMHFVKAFYLTMFLTATRNIQIVNVAIVSMLTIGMFFRSEKLRILIMKIVVFLSMLYILGVMLYEMTRVYIEPRVRHSESCNENSTDTKFKLNGIDEWFNINQHASFYEKTSSYFAIIIITAMFHGFKVTQEFLRLRQGSTRNLPTQIFDKKTTANSIFIVKFFIDFGYQVFSIELTLLAFFILIFSRLDIISLLYTPFLIILIFKNGRNEFKRFWMLLLVVISFLILIQCLIIGFFILFESCPFRNEPSFKIAFYSIKILNENPWVLTYDFVLLIVVSCQLKSSTNKHSDETNLFRYKGSDEFEFLKDFIKKFIFKFLFWIVLAIVFFIGTNDVIIFSLGYIAASFIFYWQGTDFYLKPMNTIVKWWNTLLVYNVAVILFRYAVKLFGCLYQNKMPTEYCWIFNFFDIPCSRKGDGQFCEELLDQSTHVLDIFIFYLIILQKRIFTSLYFYDTVYDTYITNLLSARGAQIMEEIRIFEITTAIDEENRILNVIKKKMEIITNSATLKNIRDGNVKRHDMTVRGGDYYMFEDEFVDKTDSTNLDILGSTVMYDENDEENIKVEETEEGFTGKAEQDNLKTKIWKLSKNLLRKLHKISKNEALIIKNLNEERKFLKDTLSLHASNELISEKIHNSSEKSRQAFLIKKIDEKFWQKTNLKLRKTMRNLDDVTIKDSLTELFYMSLTHTDLLIYFAILVNHCFYADILSLYFPLSIFSWATLTFPRPQKSFWILLIAYTQSIILVKCVTQFNIVWWNRVHPAVELLGIDSKSHYAVFDLVVLLTLFMHRTVQKTFGIWKTDENEFPDGIYELDNGSDKVKELARVSQNRSLVKEKVRVETDDSTNELIEEESKVIYRHEIKQTSQNENFVTEILKNRDKFLRANEEIFMDEQGVLSIMINQENSTVKIHPIDLTNTAREYPIGSLVVVEHELEDAKNLYTSVLVLAVKMYLSLMTNFINFLVPKYHIPRKTVDVYRFCFMCDFINFFILLIGFNTFGIQSIDDTRSILNYFEENKVPTSLLVLIIMQFIVIIIDRMLYLRKNMLGKVIFHYTMIIIIHCWMFIIVPIKTGRKFNSASPPILFYIIKFLYFLLSAYQIRCGYPARVLGNFLMRNYNVVYLIGLKIFMFIPFLFELRTLIDWTFTPTSLGFSEWMRVETIYVQIFKIKCTRNLTKNAKRGEKKSWGIKIALGGGFTLLIVAIIWFPLVLFAYSPSLGQSGIPKNVYATFEIGNYEPINRIDIRTEQMIRFNKASWNRIMALYDKYSIAQSFLDDFDEKDVVMLHMNINSSNIWNISPPNLNNIIEDLINGKKMTISATYEINELGYLKDKDAVKKFQYVIEDENERDRLIATLKGNSSIGLLVPKLLPKFLHLSSTGKFSVVEKLFVDSFDKQESLRNVYITMITSENGQSWWRLQEDCRNDYYKYLLQHIPYHDCENYMSILIFTEKLFPSELRGWAAKGLLGFYLTVVVFCSRILRTTLINSGTVTIIVEELPSVDKILNLCKNIYMVREAKQFSLEEDLVAKLIFLYRSPETLIKWTKYKEN